MTTFLFDLSLLAALMQAGLTPDLNVKPRNEVERLVLSEASGSALAEAVERAGDADHQARALLEAGFRDKGVQGKCHWFAYVRTVGSNGLQRFGSACLSSERPLIMMGKGFLTQAVAPESGAVPPPPSMPGAPR